MKTKYDTFISDKLTLEYLDYLTNKIFALLPMFEESNESIEKEQRFKIYQNTLIQTINGNTNLINYQDSSVINILSHLESLRLINNQPDYKRHVLKICKLITELKKGVSKDGV